MLSVLLLRWSVRKNPTILRSLKLYDFDCKDICGWESSF